MFEELLQLLQRQTDAVTTVEGRLRALELLVAAGEPRFVGLALDELESATERLAGLELTRSLVLHAAGWSEVTGSQLVARIADDEDAARLSGALGELRVATDRLHEARERARTVVTRSLQSVRSRVDATTAFAAV